MLEQKKIKETKDVEKQIKQQMSGKEFLKYLHTMLECEIKTLAVLEEELDFLIYESQRIDDIIISAISYKKQELGQCEIILDQENHKVNEFWSRCINTINTAFSCIAN